MLLCKRCNFAKEDSEFYLSNRASCKECVKKGVRGNRVANIDYYRAYDRARGSRQTVESTRKYREDNGGKYKAHNAINNGIRDGKIAKPEACEDCGRVDSIHGHHDDYSKPLDVRWLCAACHHQWHAINGEAANT